MKQNWKFIGLATIGAGLMVYPLMRLFRYLTNGIKQENKKKSKNDNHHIKAFVPAYRGVHKPHHRHNPGK